MRLVVVSNRLPFTVAFKEGVPEFKPGVGGLITRLRLCRKLRRRCLRMGWKSARKGTNATEALPLPGKNGGRTGKGSCKSVAPEEIQEKGLRW
jgi:hypothetical protein